LVLAVALDKAMAKRLVAAAGVPTPKFHVAASDADLAGVALRYPLFAKPLTMGTGLGISPASRAGTPDALAALCRDLWARFAQPVLIEEYLPGREMTTGILGTGKDARVLGTMEFTFRHAEDNAIYSYLTKEECESRIDYFPMPPGELRAECERIALAAFRALECRDSGRVDLRLDADGRPNFIEINPLAGLHPTHSDLCLIATQEGMSYVDLIGAIVRSATTRLGT
jgi:D-alanine-D-alanine ligase